MNFIGEQSETPDLVQVCFPDAGMMTQDAADAVANATRDRHSKRVKTMNAIIKCLVVAIELHSSQDAAGSPDQAALLKELLEGFCRHCPSAPIIQLFNGYISRSGPGETCGIVAAAFSMVQREHFCLHCQRHAGAAFQQEQLKIMSIRGVTFRGEGQRRQICLGWPHHSCSVSRASWWG